MVKPAGDRITTIGIRQVTSCARTERGDCVALIPYDRYFSSIGYVAGSQVIIRQIYLFDQEVRIETGRALAQPMRRVAAAAVVTNPLAGKGAVDDLSGIAELSFNVGEILTKRAIDALGERAPTGYGKAAIVGLDGDVEHGYTMIHTRLGAAMRKGANGGPALIPGNVKIASPGTPIDIVFGGLETEWDIDHMDAMTISVPDAPRTDEVLLIVAYISGTRPNARAKSGTREAVAKAVADMRAAKT